MKYLKAIISIPLLFGLLYGCNANEGDQVTIDNPNNNEQTDGTEDDKGIDTQTEGQTQKDENNGDATDQNATDNQKEGAANGDTAYNFTHFDLDIEYANDKSFDVEYENDQKGMRAEYDDEINGVRATGDDAMNKIGKSLELLTFDANSDPEEIKSQIISAFELDENYKEFDLEVRFTNGEVKEYNFKG